MSTSGQQNCRQNASVGPTHDCYLGERYYSTIQQVQIIFLNNVVLYSFLNRGTIDNWIRNPLFRQRNMSTTSLYSPKWATIWCMYDTIVNTPWRTGYIEYIHMRMLCVKSNLMLFPYYPLDLNNKPSVEICPMERSGEI